MKRRSPSLSIDDFNALVHGAPGAGRCMNIEFLLHLKRAVREILREQASSTGHSSAGKRGAQSVPYGTELH
jgi:predicted ATPase